MPRPDGSFQESPKNGALQLNRDRLLARLEQLQSLDSLEELRREVADLWSTAYLTNSELGQGAEEDRITFNRAYLGSAFDQIASSHTLSRALYYVKRLIKGITEIRTSPINDINLNRWKEYDHINTDSLWRIERRDNSGVHKADYWGNFVPQIPRQMMLRYTRQGEWVLDPFAGAGTTLIEGQRLGRNSLGIELQPCIADRARQLIAAEPNEHQVQSRVVTGNSLAIDYGSLLEEHGQHSVQLVIMHPPYFDIIQFSEDPRDLSNAASVSEFVEKMGVVAEKVGGVLDKDRFLILVIGDKYSKGEWIPLGFLTMDAISQRGFTLKSIVVKNFEQTSGKRNRTELWRYRALAGGFYIFKHEYIFIFEKR